ncbi:unnamed protein product [Laminaria digitata]
MVMERASPKQWCNWLQIPLEHAIRARKWILVEQLIAAGSRLHGLPADALYIYGDSGTVSPGASGRGGASGGGGGSGGGRREGGQLEGATAAGASSSAAATGAAAAAAAVSAAASAASQRSCCPSGVPPPAACCERRETSTAAPRRRPAVAVIGCATAASVPVIDLAGATALVNSDELCLHRATMARDIIRMRQIIAGGVDRNATDLWSCTALHRAAEQDDAEPVRLLLAAGLDVRARDMEGYSPLHFASARGAATAIVDLLAAGSCLSDRGLNGDTPLHSAVRFLSLPTVRILLASDADENAKNCEGHTPADVTGVRPDGREIENQPDPLMAQSILALLKAAPAQRRLRTWKRRAWLVMLRARAQAEALEAAVDLGVRATGNVGLTPPADHPAAAENESVDESLRCVPANAGGCGDGGSGGGGCGGGGGGGVVGEEKGDVMAGSELSNLVDLTTGLAEEGVFQKIVRFL